MLFNPLHVCPRLVPKRLVSLRPSFLPEGGADEFKQEFCVSVLPLNVRRTGVRRHGRPGPTVKFMVCRRKCPNGSACRGSPGAPAPRMPSRAAEAHATAGTQDKGAWFGGSKARRAVHRGTGSQCPVSHVCRATANPGHRGHMAPLGLARVLLVCLWFPCDQLKISSPCGIVWGQALLPSPIIKKQPAWVLQSGQLCRRHRKNASAPTPQGPELGRSR